MIFHVFNDNVSYSMPCSVQDIYMLLDLVKNNFAEDDIYIYITNTPCYDNDHLLNDNNSNIRFRQLLQDFTKMHNNIKFLLGHHNNKDTPHVVWSKCNFAKGYNHIKNECHFLTSSMQYEVIENGEMHTITKEEKNRIFYSPGNKIKHNTIRPQDVLKYIDGDYTFLDKNGNSKGKIKDVIGNKNENEYTFDMLAQDIVNTYEQTNKIRFLKRGYFKPFYDAITNCYEKNNKQITNELIQKFNEIEDTVRCSC